MIFMVPFDGGRLSEAALAKAALYAVTLEEAPHPITKDLVGGDIPELVAVCAIPANKRYAQKKGWINPDEAFRPRSIVEQLHQQVTDIAPSANFQSLRVGRFASRGTIGSKLRKKAIELGATDVFIGSENAGRIVTPLTSVGSRVATDKSYDVHIIRQKIPPKVTERLRSNFHLPG